ncbi:MAG: SDR family NAD(P)-dependent oxidoreductase, partial [Acidobacteriota bacterium]
MPQHFLHWALRGCEGLLHLARAVGAHNRGARLLVVTNSAQAVSSEKAVDPAQAALWGIARTVRAEQPETQCTCVDLESDDCAGMLSDLWRVLNERGNDDELALRSGRRYTPRLVPRTPHARQSIGDSPSLNETRVLGISSRGVLDNLEIAIERRRIPIRGEVEVKIAAAALNFRDVLNALGMYPGDAGPLGGECAGTVVRVGPGVAHLRVGDDVVGMPASSFRDYVTASTDSFVLKPAGVSMEAAAGVPIAFLTAEYGLTQLAGMRSGDRVLIHAGAGGVGLAAIQLARRAGAEVFATAGSDVKRAYLKALGVQHVFNSRTLSFADEILAVTGGAGVDLVLNSLAGDFITESVRVLAHGGRFVEIGKGGIWTAEQMAAARPDVQYFPLYLGDVGPGVTLPMLTALLADVAEGRLTSLPHRTFPLGQAVDAFRHMAHARHIGKVLIACTGEPAAVHADATYIVTGGFGALGGAVARTLAAQGARHLVLVGRRGASGPEALELVAGLRASGVHVEAVAADIAEASGADAVFTAAAGGPPVRGIVHAAGVVDDGLLEAQSHDRFARVFRPKALGAWHLHERSRHCPLDFFVLFSSSAALLPMPGQANYAAANGFLDALAHARRAAGLPAVSINWGPWTGGGMASRLTGLDLQRWQRQGITFIPEARGLDVFARALTSAPPQLCVLPVDWPVFVASFTDRKRPALLGEVRRSAEDGSGARTPPPATVLDRLKELPPSERKRAINDEVCDAVRRVLAVPRSFVLEPHMGLRDLGMDSLIAVELRNDLQRTADRSLPSTLAFDCPSIEALTEFLWVLLSPEPPPPGVAAGAAAAGTRAAGASTDVHGLSDAD